MPLTTARLTVPDRPVASTLRQAVSELNDIVARGRGEIVALESIYDHLKAALRGAVPPAPRDVCDAPSLPLCELPGILGIQARTRGALLESIAGLLEAK
jgi:hypothetical protein